MYNCLISNQSCGGEIIRGSCIHKYRNIWVKTVQEIINQFVYILPIFVWNPSLFCFKMIYEITIDIVYIACCPTMDWSYIWFVVFFYLLKYSDMSRSMAGKVCIVTGATRGIGKGIALQLGQAGATVYITGWWLF